MCAAGKDKGIRVEYRQPKGMPVGCRQKGRLLTGTADVDGEAYLSGLCRRSTVVIMILQLIRATLDALILWCGLVR